MYQNAATLLLATAATFLLVIPGANAACEVRFFSDNEECKGMPDYAETLPNKEREEKCLPLKTTGKPYQSHEFVGCDKLYDQVSLFEYNMGSQNCEDSWYGQTNQTDGCWAQPWGGKGDEESTVSSVSFMGWNN